MNVNDRDDQGPPRRRPFPTADRSGPAPYLILLALIPLLGLAVGGYVWFIQRVEVGSNELLVLVRKVGKSLPADAGDQIILYPELLQKLGLPDEPSAVKGVVYRPLPPGRYFYDPVLWDRYIIPVTDIPQNKVGLKFRKFGAPLAPGESVAPVDAPVRGPVAGWLSPGRHLVNTFAEEVKLIDPVFIPAGSVAVQTLLSGADPANPNQYVVATGERGVQPDVLGSGFVPNNPYERRLDIVDVRSHTLDLRGDEAIEFPSNDGFDILIEGTVEYALRQEKAPYVLAAVGDHSEVINRIILPYMKSLARIEGSKLLARDFISGEKRTAFQTAVFNQLRNECYAQGIEIRAALIRRIVAPPEIAQPISDRQLAEQQIAQYNSEIKVAESEAMLVGQEEMQKQNQAIGDANREMVSVVKQAEQNKNVAITETKRKLEVAKLELQAAKETAAALLSRGQAEAEVTRLEFEAKARPLRDAVSSFGDGETYAQFFFYQKLAPALKNVYDSTDGPFADIFRALAPRRPAAPSASPTRTNDRTAAEGGSQ